MNDVSRRQLLTRLAVSLVGLHPISIALSQQPRKFKLQSDRKLNTTIAIELLTAEGTGLKAREWSELFDELGVQITVRKSILKEVPETTEEILGTSLPDVRIIGRLERDGSVTFFDRHFSLDDVAKIRDWVEGMKAYGAQGSTKGQPMWGLTKAQFEPIYLALAPEVKSDLTGQTLEKALQGFTVRQKYSLRYSATAADSLRKSAGSRTIGNDYHGLSEGAVLAAMLNEFGLGFHPRRAPDGKIDLTIVKLGENVETWPAGWPPDRDLVKLRPIFFQTREVELIDEPLLDVVQAIGDIIEMPVLIDEFGLKTRKIDVRTRKISHKKKNVILSAALKHVCYQAKCKFEFRMDEAGRPLFWLTADTPPKDEK